MKKNGRFAVFAAAILCLCALSGTVMAQQVGNVWKVYDTESPILVKYTGTEQAYIQVANGALYLRVGDVTNTVALSSIPVSSNLILIAACTNSAGTAGVFEGKLWAALSADTLGTNCVAVSETAIEANTWSGLVKWDASQVKHADAAVSRMIGDGVYNPRLITRILGDPIGTGNVTVKLYDNETVIYQKTVTSPVYVPGADGISTSGVTEAGVYLDIPVQLAVPSGDVVWLRVTRATTMTTTSGGVGVGFAY